MNYITFNAILKWQRSPTVFSILKMKRVFNYNYKRSKDEKIQFHLIENRQTDRIICSVGMPRDCNCSWNCNWCRFAIDPCEQFVFHLKIIVSSKRLHLFFVSYQFQMENQQLIAICKSRIHPLPQRLMNVRQLCGSFSHQKRAHSTHHIDIKFKIL